MTKNALDEKVEFFCREMCKELNIDPDAPSEYRGYGFVNEKWEDFKPIVRDWLITEAFSKIRTQYWNDLKYQEVRAKKQIVTT
ncbi:MAG TPA: hypothetical protein VEP90_22540 [Methylomirabilota bacterium]|nr:hypothetical protein [Methylomirabilota bacterium]